MKLLHTGDWHLGKVLKGVDRLPEQARVLQELVGVADRERVDLVVVAGDVFDTAAPSAEAQALAWRTLLDLRETGAAVVVVAGNHDHPDSFEALRPVWGALGITVLGRPARVDAGGVLEMSTRSGDGVRVAMLPFVSQRGIVKAQHLLQHTAIEAAQAYDARMRAVVGALTEGFASDAVNVVVAHATVVGGRMGGGEREAQSVFEYVVSGHAFPSSAHYVALGHLHRSQQVAAACPAWYPGSPIAVDFGEEEDAKGVLVVEATPRTPAVVRAVPLAAAVRLRTLRGSFEQLEAMAGDVGDALLRVIVEAPVRAGLADQVRAMLPNALEVRVESPAATGGSGSPSRLRAGVSPQELFAAFCAREGVEDPAVTALFAELLDAPGER
jgi:DNA repair protein SbcD/Mre11